jgi:hypothetical protein
MTLDLSAAKFLFMVPGAWSAPVSPQMIDPEVAYSRTTDGYWSGDQVEEPLL